MSSQMLEEQEQTIGKFTTQYSANLSEVLNGLGGSIMLTTYQAGKVITVGLDGKKIVQLARSFDPPMGLSFPEDYTC